MAGAFIASLMMLTLVGLIIWNEWRWNVERAEVSVQNTGRILADSVDQSFNSIDVFLQSIALRFTQSSKSKTDNLENFDYILGKESELLPFGLYLRIIDRTGVLRTLDEQNRAEVLDLSDREYFLKARDGANGLIFSGPLQSKRTGEWVLVLARRLSSANGDFGGVVFALLPIKAIEKPFQAVDLGRYGAINMRALDLAQIARHPPLEGENTGPGNRNVSKMAQELLKDSPESIVYRVIAPIDGIERVYTYQRFPHYPFYISLGRATADFNTGWYQSLVALSVLCAIITGGFFWFATRLYRNALHMDQENRMLEVHVANRTRDLDQARQVAEQSARVKTEFLANMSHEIRTPMNSIIGFLNLVLEGELPAAVRKQLMTARDAARSLLALLNDILDISKLQNGQIKLEKVPFNLLELMQTTLSVMRIKARDKTLALQFFYPPDMPSWYLGDPTRIRQIVTNLIGNAIKFTAEGGVTVRLSENGENETVELSIADTGIGMTDDEMGRIFTPFVQADSSTTRRFGGTGLGVSICKQLTEKMGGSIHVDSRPGEGSVFRVILPLARSNPIETPAEEHLATSLWKSAPRRFRVLVVDDIEDNIELAVVRLTKQGHIVTTASNGHEAVKAALDQDFDIILMDVQMPEMNGLDATREIRRRSDSDYEVPVIALTAGVLQSEQQECFDAGMTAFIGKPIDFGQLFHLIESLIPQERGERMFTPEQPAESASKSLPPLDGIDTLVGLRRWEDLRRYVKALQRFPAKFGSSGTDLAHLLDASDSDNARELLHALKGVAANLALTDVAQAASALEESLSTDDPADAEVLLAKLSDALTTATASISRLKETSVFYETATAADANQVANAGLEELKAALETDDPDAIEKILNGTIVNLEPRHLARIGALVADFEFDEARKYVARLSAETTGDHRP